jgi:hypothetical protein
MGLSNEYGGMNVYCCAVCILLAKGGGGGGAPPSLLYCCCGPLYITQSIGNVGLAGIVVDLSAEVQL